MRAHLAKSFFILALVVGFTCILAKPAHANIPEIAGYVKVAGTNAPVPNVWVKLTSNGALESGCVEGSFDQSRYTKTDSSGKYTFISWTTGGSSGVGEGVQIDTNLDGKNDAEEYPTYDACEGPGASPGSIFSCGRDPFRVEVVRPVGWSGTFDTFGNASDKPCVFCLNNGQYTYEVPVDLFYHPGGSSGGTNPGTITACQILMDNSGNVNDGSASSGSTFSLRWFSPTYYRSDWDPAIAVLPTYSFTTPLSLNTKLPGFPSGPGAGGNNAQCKTYTNLAKGQYYYRDETVPAGMSPSLIHDSYTDSPSISNMGLYNGGYYDNDPSNDSGIDGNYDGHIGLYGTEPVPYNRTLVLLNKGISSSSLPGSITLSNVPPLSVGGSAVAVGVSSSANVTSATFTITNTAGTPIAVSTCPTSSCSSGQFTFTDTPGFNAFVKGFATGTATLTVTCTVSGGGVCTGDSATITVANAAAWWQSVGGDIVTTGNILSTIPTSCVAPSCKNTLITYQTNTSPGVAVAGGSIGTGDGTVSQNAPPYGWQSKSTYNGNVYTYDYFENKSKCGTIQNLSSSTVNSVGDLTALGASSGGYYWVRYEGATPLTLKDLNVGNNKVVLFVKNQDLHIDGNITVNAGTGFFMTIVGGSTPSALKNIQVNPSVRELSGIFFVDGQFKTGTTGTGSDVPLHVKGSVAAMSKIILERSLANNATAPSEVFEYSPDQMLLFPSCLGESSVQWKELAP